MVTEADFVRVELHVQRLVLKGSDQKSIQDSAHGFKREGGMMVVPLEVQS